MHSVLGADCSMWSFEDFSSVQLQNLSYMCIFKAAGYIYLLLNKQPKQHFKRGKQKKDCKQTNKHEKQKENKSKKIQSFHQSLVQRSFRHICHFYMVISHLQSAKYRLLVQRVFLLLICFLPMDGWGQFSQVDLVTKSLFACDQHL